MHKHVYKVFHKHIKKVQIFPSFQTLNFTCTESCDYNVQYSTPFHSDFDFCKRDFVPVFLTQKES